MSEHPTSFSGLFPEKRPEQSELTDADIQQVYLKVHADGFSGRDLETAFARAILAAARSKT